MEFKKLLPILFTVGMLAACTPAQSGSGSSKKTLPAENEDGTHTVTINNTSALEAEWILGGAPRTLELTLNDGTGEKAALTELAQGKLTFTIEDSKVINVEGLIVNAVGTGSSKLAVKYYDTVKHLTFTVTSVAEKYGAKHQGTEKDPFDNEDALIVAKGMKEDGGFSTDKFYFKGKVDSFYHVPGERTDKICSWFMTPNKADGEQFEIYKCAIMEGATQRQWTDNDIWEGATFVARGNFAFYGGQYETGAAELVKNHLSHQPKLMLLKP